ncbi:hypothetical protein PHMEG_00039636 [Phytophthora megakarya]|uniref:Uncharacterized protein n=1 Tax=Phytophthora megakarya TaxID=4795 RepID=A0A225UFD0_9STRA|nr:hypothetical protein PHMEG_00039636 [Phytophthora megakarya]
MLSSATRSTAWGVAVEYFRLFPHGDKAPKLLHQFVPESNVQRDFLRATMSPDATDGDVIGVNALMAKWRFYSQSHGDFL